MKITHIVMGLVALAGVGMGAGAWAQPGGAGGSGWKPAGEHIRTRWAKDVKADAPLPEYPRPQLVREKWVNLNGLWEYRVLADGDDGAGKAVAEGRILVPFPIESSLSGVARRVKATETVRQSRVFTVPADWDGKRVVLHFGAVNWQSEVSVNGKKVGEHTGGYDPFSIDVTDALKSGENEVVVTSKNPGNSGGQPRGKQYDTSHSIWYESSSGIWQTVWMEPVPAARIEKIVAKTTVGGEVEFVVQTTGGGSCKIEVMDGAKVVGTCEGDPAKGLKCTVAGARLWSPDAPNLYQVRATLGTGAGADSVKSYFGFREITMAKDGRGINRLMLNGKPVFQYGPLDQGYWPDGLYTAPTDEALKFDIEAAKRMGCNMIRKHVKVEPERWYYWCDTLGIMVWQDMPSPFFASKEANENFPEFSEKWAKNFETEWKAIMEARGAHPSIVMWVPFNEGWGQNDRAWAKSMVLKTKESDPTRLVNNASGWHDMGVGDVHDMHNYPEPATYPVEEKRACVLGEFGGLGLPLEGHTWVTSKDNWGYRTYKTADEVTTAYCGMMDQIPALIAQGMCAAVYTQTTDVEIECNGWMTYDREVWKVDPTKAAAATQQVYGPPPVLSVVMPHAGEKGSERMWKYSLSKPGKGWLTEAAAVADWKEGPGGFGSRGTPGAIIGTEWTTPEIWIRTEFTLDEVPTRPQLSLHHDEDAEVYINGVRACAVKGYTAAYQMVRMSPEAVKALKKGVNTMAIHCKQTTGGQYVDCGMVEFGTGRRGK